jgi:phospholipase C
MPRINHFIVLMLENRSFDHLFGFFPPPAGETIENLLALHSPAVNLPDPSRPDSKVWKSPRQPKAKRRPPSQRNSRPPDSEREAYGLG